MPEDTAVLATKIQVDAEPLAEALEATGKALTVLEDLCDVLDGKRMRDIEQGTLWMLEGFITDLLLDIRELASGALKVRSAANGGIATADLELAAWAGFDA